MNGRCHGSDGVWSVWVCAFESTQCGLLECIEEQNHTRRVSIYATRLLRENVIRGHHGHGSWYSWSRLRLAQTTEATLNDYQSHYQKPAVRDVRRILGMKSRRS